jgi:phage terminase large subunit GpA-like protein
MTEVTEVLVEETEYLRERAAVPRWRSIREFAEAEIVIPEGKNKGRRFRCAVNPFTHLFFDILDEGVFPFTFFTGVVQSGKTFLATIVMMYYLFERKENYIYGLPSMDMAGDKWELEIRPVIAASQYGRFLPVKGPGSRGGKAGLIHFTNGTSLKFMTAGGGDGQRAGFTAGRLGLTELDKFDDSGGNSDETDRVSQMVARLGSYRTREKRVVGECTLTTEQGRTFREIKAGSDTSIFCPCPHCQHAICPQRKDLVGWQEADSDLQALKEGHWLCPACGQRISEAERYFSNTRAVLVHRGQRAVSDGDGGLLVEGPVPETLTLGLTYNPYNNFLIGAGDVAMKEWKAQRSAKPDDAEKEMCQLNWAVPWKPAEVEVPVLSVDDLLQRKSKWPENIVPDDAIAMSMGMDVHKRLIYYVVIAWGDEAKGYVISYGQVETGCDGDDQPHVSAGIKRALGDIHDMVSAGWRSGEDVWIPQAIFIDARYQKETVYDFCAEKGNRYRPAMGFGEHQQGRGIYSAPKSKTKAISPAFEHYYSLLDRWGLHQANINTNFWKEELFERLSIGQDSPGALTLYASPHRRKHFRFAKHMMAETLVEEHVPGRGLVKRFRVDSTQNHFLDCAYMALVAGWLAGGGKMTQKEREERRREAIEAKERQKGLGGPFAGKKLTTPDGRPWSILAR